MTDIMVDMSLKRVGRWWLWSFWKGFAASWTICCRWRLIDNWGRWREANVL